MAEDIRRRVGEKESEILSGQIMMLSDPFMTGQMEEMIASGSCAEAALDSVCQMYIEMFSNVDDELMRQRATDIRDIRTRMLRLLLGISSVDIASVPAGTVLVAKDLTPSMTVGLKRKISVLFLLKLVERPAILRFLPALWKFQQYLEFLRYSIR